MSMEQHYRKEKDLLKRMGHPFGTNKTINVWIAELLVDCFNLKEIPRNKIDIFFDILGNLFKELGIKDNDAEYQNDFRKKAFGMVRDSGDKYDDYLKNYAVREKINDCGDYYKNVIGKDPNATECLKELLEDYSKGFAPLVYDMAVDFLVKHSRDREKGPIHAYDFTVEKEEVSKDAFDKYIGKYESLLKSI